MKQYGKQGAAKQGPTNIGLSGKAGPGFKAKQVLKGVAKKAMKNPGKAGLAMAGLAAAGGLGMAGAKAIGNARKPKSLTDRLKNASKKMFK